MKVELRFGTDTVVCLVHDPEEYWCRGEPCGTVISKRGYKAGRF